MNPDNETKVTFTTPVGEIESTSFNQSDIVYHSINVREPQYTSIKWGYPDIVEMEDDQGKIHKYSIIEILDGLTRLARRNKKCS